MTADDRSRLAAFRQRVRESARVFGAAYRIRDASRRLGAPVEKIEIHAIEDRERVIVLILVGDDWHAIGELAGDAQEIEPRLLRALAVIDQDRE